MAEQQTPNELHRTFLMRENFQVISMISTVLKVGPDTQSEDGTGLFWYHEDGMVTFYAHTKTIKYTDYGLSLEMLLALRGIAATAHVGLHEVKDSDDEYSEQASKVIPLYITKDDD